MGGRRIILAINGSRYYIVIIHRDGGLGSVLSLCRDGYLEGDELAVILALVIGGVGHEMELLLNVGSLGQGVGSGNDIPSTGRHRLVAVVEDTIGGHLGGVLLVVNSEGGLSCRDGLIYPRQSPATIDYSLRNIAGICATHRFGCNHDVATSIGISYLKIKYYHLIVVTGRPLDSTMTCPRSIKLIKALLLTGSKETSNSILAQ